MKDNFTLQDILGVVRVLPCFLPVLMAPGYVLGAAFNPLNFRQRQFTERILLSILFSCVLAPYCISTLGRFLSIRYISVIFILISAAFLLCLFREWSNSRWALPSRIHRTTGAVLALLCLWTAIALGSLSDLQIGNALYSTPATFDHVYRSTFIASILRTGVPPSNPFFYPAHAVPLRYYYYWNALCAVPAFLADISPRIALYASCVWSGFCVAALIPVFFKDFLRRTTNIRFASLIGIALLGITGLDILPTLFLASLRAIPPFADMEWWDPDQISSWLDSFLWVPHHIAALTACLTGLLLLWNACFHQQSRSRALPLLLASIAFASAAGLSVYVMLTFAVFLALWAAYLLLQKNFKQALLVVCCGSISALISIGYLGDLRAHGSTLPGSSAFLHLSLRQLPAIFAPFAELLGGHHPFWTGLCSLPFTGLTLFLELGVFLVVGVSEFIQDRASAGPLSQERKCLWILNAASLGVLLFLRSAVIANNDLAWRAALPLQFVLLLWTASWLADFFKPLRSRSHSSTSTPRKRYGMRLALLLLGAISSIYQIFMLRAFPILSEQRHWESILMLAPGHQALQIREMYARIEQLAPPDSVVQYNPDSPWTNQLLLYSSLQHAAAFSPSCGTAYGGTPQECAEILPSVDSIYDPSTPAPKVAAMARSLGIDLLIVTSADRLWTQTQSWAWSQPALIENESVRVYKPASWTSAVDATEHSQR